MTSSTNTITILPCDLGVPGGTVRGWHHFEAGPNGIVVCRYCGKRASSICTGHRWWESDRWKAWVANQ